MLLKHFLGFLQGNCFCNFQKCIEYQLTLEFFNFEADFG